MSSRRDLVINAALVTATALAVVGLVRLLTEAIEIVILLLVSVILAAGFAPVVGTLQRTRIRMGRRTLNFSKPAAILVVYAVVFLVLVSMAAAVVAPLVAQARGFMAAVPRLVGGIQAYLQSLEVRYPWLPDFSGLLGTAWAQLGGFGRVGTAARVAFGVVGGVLSVLTILFVSFYMLIDGPAIKRTFLSLVPRERRQAAEAVLHDIGLKFGGWLRGQLLLGLIIGLAAGVGTWLLGLPFPLLLGLIAGITELIPIIGPIIGAVPAVLVSLFIPPWYRALEVIALYAIIQQMEANFVVPRVMRMAVGLSPLLTIVALLVGAELLGVIGALLAIPVAAALQVIAGEIIEYVQGKAAWAPPRAQEAEGDSEGGL